MKTTAIQRKLMLTALLALAPAGAAWAAPALAAQDCSADPHAAYRRGLGGDDPGYQCVSAAWQPSGAAGPAGPVIAANMPCGRDPFEGYQRGIGRGEGPGSPAQLCGLMVPEQSGARGPAGQIMADERSDPFWAYQRTFPAESSPPY